MSSQVEAVIIAQCNFYASEKLYLNEQQKCNPATRRLI
jgi:hypothetical protein